MYKSGKFWVVAGLFFLGSVVISDVHVSAQESEITTAKAATEVMEIGDPITEEATFAEESVVNEIIGNEAGPSKEQVSVLNLEEQVDTVKTTVTSNQVEEEQKNEMNESAEASETEDFILTVNPIKDTDTVVTGVANKNTLVSVVDEQGNILGEGYTDGEGNFSITIVNLKTKELVRVNSNYTGSSPLDVNVEVIEENDKQVTPRMLRNEPLQALESLNESDLYQETVTSSSGNTEVVISTPKSVDTLNEKMITVARYAIKYPNSNTRYNDDLVISYDPDTKTTYALRVDRNTNAIKQRVKMSKSDQQIGFGQNALFRFNSVGYELNGAASVNSTTMMVIERYGEAVSSNGWRANYKKEKLPANIQLSVNFVDELGNKIIDSDTFNLFQGQKYSITSNPKELSGYKFIEHVGNKTGDVLTGDNLSLNYVYRIISVEINQPTEGDQVVTGTGIPGDDIKLTDKDGNVIGEGKVGEDGKFEITPTRPLVPNEVITATPSTDGKEGTPSDTTVVEKPFDKDAHKPEVNQPTEGDESITGKGQPGDKIVITDKDGNVIGEGEVDKDGNFDIKPDRPLVPNEVITATPSTDGKEGTPSDTTVAEKPFDKDAHKPEINQPTEGDQVVTGTGTPGDDIKLTDKDGNVIGEGKVGEDGKFEITPTRPLVPGETLIITPYTNGKGGTSTSTVVKKFDKVNPTQPGNGNSNINKDTFISKDTTPSINNTSKKQTLPQTGSATSSGLMSLGAILSSLSGLYIFRRNRK